MPASPESGNHQSVLCIYELSRFFFFWFFRFQISMVFVYLCQTYVTQHNALEIHLHCGKISFFFMAE